MNDTCLFISVTSVSFLIASLGTKILLRKISFLRERRPVESAIFFGRDMAKEDAKLIPTMGGLAIAFGFAFALLFSLKLVDATSAVNILAGLVTILLITIIGFMDDTFIMRKRWRIVLPAVAALPLIAVDTGVPHIRIFDNIVYLGGFYTYILIPVGVIACANLINILAGFNGLEAGCGAIASLSIFSASIILEFLEPGRHAIATPVMMLALFGACAGFLLFNWYPARIFPGNVGTYVIGASIASAVIIGDMEKIGVIALMPQILEFFFKIRGNFKSANFGTLVNGTLIYEGRISSLTHVVMKYAKVDERRLVEYLLILQVFFGCLAVSSVFWYR